MKDLKSCGGVAINVVFRCTPMMASVQDFIWENLGSLNVRMVASFPQNLFCDNNVYGED